MRIRRLLAVLAVVVAVPLVNATAASATSYYVPTTGFTLWPGPFCGFGAGSISNDSGLFYISSLTQSTSGSPNCPNNSPANAGIFAAQAYLYKRVSGNLAFCSANAHRENLQGDYLVIAGGYVTGCGTGYYRVDARWRITYGGTPQQGDAYNSADVYYS